MNKLRVYSFLIIAFLFLQIPVQSQIQLGTPRFSYKDPKQYTIASIQFPGHGENDPERLKNLTGLREGKTIMVPGDDISLALEKLWKSDDYSDIQIFATKTIGTDIWLKVQLTEKEKLSRYTPKGDISKSEVDNLREALTLRRGMRVDENLLNRIERVSKSYFINKGFYNCSVDVTKQLDTLLGPNQVRLFINIDKGERVKIKEIVIEGADEMQASKLRRKMKKTKQKKWYRFFSTSKFIPSEYRNDKKNILSHYQSEAYRDADIVFDTVYRNDDNTISIHMKIDEGSQYYIRNITWIGNTKYRSTFLDTVLGIERGDKYSQGVLDTRLSMNPAGTDVSSLYMDDGYLFFNVNPVEVMVENDSVDLEMRIYEGKQAMVNRVIIKGNDRTSEHVVRREIKTRPGDLFNRNDAIRTQQLLAQLGYFNPETLGIEPVPNQQDGTVDITYTVEERPSDQIELSGGWGAGRVVGTLGVSFSNFSLRKFFKFKTAWKPLPSGDGQRLSIRAQSNGVFFQSYNFSFTEPWLGGKRPNSFSFTGWHSVQSLNGLPRMDPNRSFIKIYGLSAGLGFRLKKPDDYFNFFVEGSYQYYVLQNFGSVFTFSDGYSNNASLRLALTRNSVDQPIFPRSGSTISLSYKFTPPYSLFDGVDDYSDMSEQDKFDLLEYNKIKFSSSFFTTLSKNRKLVLNARMGFGFLQEWNSKIGPSPFERFYLGGSGLTGFNLDGREIIALRGYSDNAVSPGQGGLLISKYTAELRYPVSLNPNATIYGLAFVEAGNTWNDWKNYNPFQVKRSAGLGVRIFLPMFGLMGLDYGWGFDPYDPGSQGFPSQPTLPSGQFHFTIGMNLGEL